MSRVSLNRMFGLVLQIVKMVQRVATDERPFETPSSDESGLGRSDSPSEESQPEAALVSTVTHWYNNNITAGILNRLRSRS